MTTTRDTFRPQDLATFVDVLAADHHGTSGHTVYASNTVDGHRALERSVLWLVDRDGEARVLSPAADSQTAAVISPRGSVTAFHQQHEGRWQLGTAAHATGDLRILTDLPRGTFPIPPTWSPEGNHLAFVASDRPPRDPTAAYLVDRPVWRVDGIGLIEDVVGDIWIVGAAGGLPRRLTDHDGVILMTHWSPDGAHLLYSTIAESDSTLFRLRTVDVATGASTVVLEGRYLGYPPQASWLPDGRIVYATPWDMDRARDLHVADPCTGRHEALGLDFSGQLLGALEPGMSSSLLAPVILPDPAGDIVYVRVQRGGRVETVRVSIGERRIVDVVAPWRGSTYPVAVSGETLLLARMSVDQPVELDLVIPAGQTRRTHIDRTRHHHAPFTVENITFPTRDGAEVEAWFLAPRARTGPHPTVVRLHGGPFAGIGQVYSVDDAMLTSAGFGVLLVNFRGSSGYGEDFAAGIRAAWGDLDAADVLAGVAVAIERGWADPDRLAAFGLSGGGFLTSWLLTHSDLFRTGITECGISDWTAMVGSDIPEAVTRWMGTRPGLGEASMAPYIRASPLTYAAGCRAPMLIIEHEDDLRCPPGQGDILYHALHQASTEVAMLRLPGMSHGDVYEIGDLAGRIARATAIVEWLGRHLAPQPADDAHVTGPATAAASPTDPAAAPSAPVADPSAAAGRGTEPVAGRPVVPQQTVRSG